jgi:transporter family-2 protein
MMWGLAYILSAGAGVSFVIQQAVNANLRSEIGSAWWAGFVSYAGGTLVMLMVALVLQEPWFSKEAVLRSHLLSWTGGLFGAIYIAISIALVSRLGATLLIALIVAGQMLASVTFDHFGLFGLPVHAMTLSRVMGPRFL